MKYKGLFLAVVVLLIISGIHIGYSEIFLSENKDFGEEDITRNVAKDIIPGPTVTVTDACGRQIAFSGPVKRIAYSHHSISDSLKIAGVWDRVVGRDANIDDALLFPGYEKIPVISQKMNPMDLNYEKIIEIKPEVMILPKFDWYSGQEDIIAKLEPDIPVLFLDFLDPDPGVFCDNLKTLGKITGNEKEVLEYSKFYLRIYNEITAKTALISKDERPDVFFRSISKTSPENIATYGNGMIWFNNFISAAGADNVAENLSVAYTDVDREWILGRDIDAIVVKCRQDDYPDVFGYYVTDHDKALKEAELIRNEIMSMEIFSESDAVKSGNVFLFDQSMDATQMNIIGIACLAKWLYPDLFSDLDTQALHSEYLEKFMKADYDLNKSGVFAFPS